MSLIAKRRNRPHINQHSLHNNSVFSEVEKYVQSRESGHLQIKIPASIFGRCHIEKIYFQRLIWKSLIFSVEFKRAQKSYEFKKF